MEIPNIFLGGISMHEYKNMAEKIIDFLDENHYCRAVINGTLNCLNSLEVHFSQTETTYTPEVADEWFCSIKMTLSKNNRKFYKSTLIKLQDVYETGGVRPNHNSKSYTMLNKTLKNLLDNYI